MTRAIRIHRTGGPQALELDSVDLPEPGPGEALVEQQAIGVNYIDSSEEKAELVRSRGASEVIVYTSEDFPARVRELTSGAGVPVAFDSVGKDTFQGSLSCLALRGTLVCFGNASGKREPFARATTGSSLLLP